MISASQADDPGSIPGSRTKHFSEDIKLIQIILVLCIDLSYERKILENLDPKYFQHQLDTAATNNLDKVRGVDLFTKKFM